MKHVAAAEFANYLENVPDSNFRMMDASMCVAGHINKASGLNITLSGPHYWEKPTEVLGSFQAARAIFYGNNYYTGIFGNIKNWFLSEFAFLFGARLELQEIRKDDAIRMLRRYAETGNVVWR